MKRQGLTLTEVLVAIFVTGLGLMALMTLFPLGAINMATAVKDDRTQQAAANANALLRAMWRSELENAVNNVPADGTFFPLQTGGAMYLDPVGCLTYAANTTSIGGVIPRTMPAAMFGVPTPLNQASAPTIFSYFGLMDDINFDLNGRALQNSSNLLPRQYLYTWAYMIRPRTLVVNPNAPPAFLPPRGVDYSIVVYNRRSALAKNLGQSGEIPWGSAVTFTGGVYGNQKTIMAPGTGVVNKGNWVLDVTTACFYRVDSVSVIAGPTTVLKVDQPLRCPAGNPNWQPWQGPMMVMEFVSEVFEKSTLE